MTSALEKYQRLVEQFTSQLLKPYLARLKRRSPLAFSGKELNDVVWQTIVIQPFEVIILDSPLLQRLREMRQLGVAHWVYPAGGHSRFEHSVGALNQVQRLTDALNEHTRQKAPDSGGMIPPDWINLLRLAALCHDVGHGLMSHVSENALDSLGLIKDLELELEDHLDLEDCSLSEAAAYFMLGSPGFSELLALARTLTEHDLPRDTPRLLQKLVAGALVHPRFPLLQELISGPFDADKLDYMNRDACMTGVPVVTDIPRLIQKLRQVEVDAADLPADIAKNVRRQERKPSYFIQAVMLSGARTIDELMLGRTLLYDKVYRHQKVRAVEAMVAVVVAGLAKLARQPAMLPLLIEDRDLLELRRETLSEKLGAPISDGAWRELRGARAVADRLRQRALFVRAYAFSQTMPRDPFRADAMQTHALGQLQSDVEKPSARMELLRRIVEQLRRMRLSCHRISSDTQLR